MSELALVVTAKTSQAIAGLKGVENELGNTAKQAKTASQSLKDFGAGMSNIGAGLSVGVTLPLVALGTAAIAAGEKLNAGMANIASLNIASDRVNELKSNIKDMEIQFGSSAENLTDGTYQIISAFGDTSDTAKILETNLKIAAGGVATLTQAVDLTSAVTMAWGDTSLDAIQHVGDLALKSVELGKTTLPDLASAIGKVTGMSKGLGISQEEMFATFATASGVMGTTSEVATGYRGVLQALQSPTETMTKLIKSQGFANGEAMVKGLGWGTTLQVIAAAAKGAGGDMQPFISSIDGANLALLLSGSLSEKYTSNVEGMNNAIGKTDDAYKAQTEGVNASAFAMKQASGMIQVFLQDISDGMGPALLAFIDMIFPLGEKLLTLSNTFATLDPTTQKWIVGIVAAVAALGPLLVIIGSVVSAIGAALPVLGAIGGALAALVSPIGLIVVALGALVYFNWDNIKAFASEGLGRIATAAPLAGSALGELVAQLTGIGLDTYDTTENIQALVTALTGSESAGTVAADTVFKVGSSINSLSTAVQKFVSGSDVSTAINSLSESFDSIKGSFGELLSGDIGISDFISKIGEAVAGIPAIVSNVFSGADFSALKGQVVAALGLDNISFENVLASLESFGSNLASAINEFDYAGAFSSLSSTVSTAVSSALGVIDWSGITTGFESLKTSVVTMLSGIDWSGAVSDLGTKANGLRDGLLSGLTNQINGIDWSGMSLDVAGFVNNLAGKINSIDWSQIKVEDIGKGLAAIVAPALTAGIAAISWVISSDSWTGLVDSVKNAFSSIQWGEIGTSFANLGTAITNAITGLDWSGITTALAPISQAITGFKFPEITFPTLADIEAAANSFRDNLIQGLTNKINGLDLTAALSGILSSLTTGISSINFSGAGEALGKAVSFVLSPDGLTAIFAGAVTAIAPAFTAAIASIVWITSSDNFSGLVSSVGTAISGINWGTVSEKFSELKSAISEGWTEFSTGFFKGAGIEPPDWSQLISWPNIEWPGWDNWISFPKIDWGGWSEFIVFPKIEWPGWSSFISFPTIPNFPGWGALVSGVTSLIPGIGGKATGDSSWKGGVTWVGEKGEELLKFPDGHWAWGGLGGPEVRNLPTGTQIFKHEDSMKMIANGTAPDMAAIGRNAAGTTTPPSAASAAIARATAFGTSLGAEAATKENTKANREATKAYKDGIKAQEKVQQELENTLQKVPGLFHTSDVTQKQMDMAKLGIPQNFADDWLRHLTDEVVNGVKWDDADIKDAATRAGIDPSLPAKAILEMVKDKWNDNSLFADPKNLDLINMDAIKKSMEDQQKQAAGQKNLMGLTALFGGTPEQIQAQGQALGGQYRAAAVQGAMGAGAAGGATTPAVDFGSILLGGASFTPETMAPLAQSFMSAFASALSGGGKDSKDKDKAGIDFGAVIIGALNTSLTDSKAFDSTSQAIMKAIADSMGKVTGDTVDLMGGIAKSMDISISTKNAIDDFLNIGGKIAKVLKQGIDEYFQSANIADSVGSAVKSNSTTSVTSPNAIGTYNWRGGLTRVGETGMEVLDIPRGTRIYGSGETSAMGGGTTITNHFHVNVTNDVDVRKLAYQVTDIQNRQRRKG